MMKMHLYRTSKYRDRNELKKQLARASGIDVEKGKLPQGFSSIISFDFGDIYIDDYIYSKIDLKVENEIDNCLENLLLENYGIVTDEEKEMSLENKYFGGGKYQIGRYEISIGIIEVNLLPDCTEIRTKA